MKELLSKGHFGYKATTIKGVAYCNLKALQVFHTLLFCIFTALLKNGLLAINALKSLIATNEM